jgi:hypothetical protein
MGIPEFSSDIYHHYQCDDNVLRERARMRDHKRSTDRSFSYHPPPLLILAGRMVIVRILNRADMGNKAI